MKINLRTPYNSLGYGIVGKNILKELSKIHEVAFFPIGQPQIESQDEIPTINTSMSNSDLYFPTAPCLTIWHQHSLAEKIGVGEHYAFPIFELDKFTEREKHHLNNVDHLFVTSKWAKQIIEDNQIRTPTVVAPLGVDTQIFHPISIPKQDKTIFLNIGKMEIRKGIDFICDIFNKAFSESDNVELWMAVSNPFLKEEDTKQWLDYYGQSPLSKKIKFISRLPTQHDICQLMNIVDCGLSLSRAEGFDLEALEFMACGKQVIATNYSAHTEFCTINNAHLIDIDESEEAYDGIWFHGQGNWAKFGERQIEQCIEDMRFIHEQKQSGKDLTNINGLETAKQFSWSNTATIIERNLS